MDYKKAASYWTDKEAGAVKAAPEYARQKAEGYINSHKTCALATGRGDFVRCTPIEYNYYKGAFYLFSEGGIKFLALEKNKNVCLAIFDEYSGFSALNGMQIAGKAEMIELWSDEYRELLAFKKIKEEAIRKMDYPMYLIKIVPTEIDFMSSDFKKEGYSYRQKIRYDK